MANCGGDLNEIRCSLSSSRQTLRQSSLPLEDQAGYSRSEITKIVEGGRARLGMPALKEQQTFQRQLGEHLMAVRSARLLAHDCYGEAVAYIAKGNLCSHVHLYLMERHDRA